MTWTDDVDDGERWKASTMLVAGTRLALPSAWLFAPSWPETALPVIVALASGSPAERRA